MFVAPTTTSASSAFLSSSVAGNPMELFINGESKRVPSPLNLRKLLEHLQLPSDRVAVELNRHIVRRDAWEATTLNDQDRVEIVHFVGGG